jgi:hypothetical protein
LEGNAGLVRGRQRRPSGNISRDNAVSGGNALSSLAMILLREIPVRRVQFATLIVSPLIKRHQPVASPVVHVPKLCDHRQFSGLYWPFVSLRF